MGRVLFTAAARGLLAVAILVPATLAENYAVMFAGGVRPAKNHQRYYLATNSTYWKLTETLHFLPENVFVLAADGTNGGLDQNLHPDDSVEDLIDSDLAVANWAGYDASVTSVVDPVRQLRVCSGANLRVAGGGILHVTGDLENDGGSVFVTNARLDVDGQIDCTETALHLGLGNGGLVYAGELHTAGRVGVGDFSLLHVYADLTISGDGEVEVHDGGQMIVGDGATATVTAGNSTLSSSWTVATNWLACRSTEFR